MSRRTRFDWLSSRNHSCGRSVTRKRSAAPFRRRLRIEPLEDRLLLTTVTTLVDGIGVPGTSLREAIADATPGETIGFSVTGTINLTNLGQLVVNKNLTIVGPGADLLAINAFDPTPTMNNGDGSRVFLIDDGNLSADKTISISGLTLTGGDTTGGGAIFNSENLTLTSSTITGNAVMFGAGGVYSGNGTSLTIASSTIANNVASLGGGISTSGATLSITSSTFSGNTAASYGGGIFAQSSGVTLSSTTVSNNSATYGGGVFSRFGSLTLTNSTVSANQSTISGGGIFSSSADLSVNQSTITGNQANSDSNATGLGGGLAIYGPGAHELDHTIVAVNKRSLGSDDIFGALAASFSLIGDNTGATITNNGGTLIGTGAVPINPGLGPLLENAGPTFTHALLAGSPAIDAGDPAFLPPPTNDQRGAPFVRVFDGDGAGGARIDIGAYERQSVAGLSLVVDTLVDENDGNYAAGDLSLREAINWANGSISTETINFAPALTSGGPVTILLTRGALAINDELTMNGPGANLLMIDASGNDPTPTVNDGNGSRVFSIYDGSNLNQFDVELAGLTLTGGDVGGDNVGGAIYSLENLSLTACTISGNSSRSFGGGIASYATLSVNGSTVSDNEAISSIGYSLGGGIFQRGTSSSLTITSSTISGNAASAGGGVLVEDGVATITKSSIVGNQATSRPYSDGGGVANNKGRLTITDSTISGNTATSVGGGVLSITNLTGTQFTTIINSTISGNSAPYGGGVFNRKGLTTIRHTTITNNTASVQGGGLSASDGITRTDIHSTIIAGNSANDIAFFGVNNFQSQGYNLIGSGNAIGIFTQPGDQTGVANPLLSPLSNNGGPTMTHALLLGSPAIDAGDPNFNPADPDGNPLTNDAVPYDQRGAPFNRVYNGNSAGGARIDIGAFELQPIGPALPGDYNLNGVVDAADYTVWRNTLGQTGVTPYSGADGDGDAVIDADDYAVWKSHFGETLPPGAGGWEQGVGTAVEGPHPGPLPEGEGVHAALADFGELDSTELAEVSRVEPVAPAGQPVALPGGGAAESFAAVRTTAKRPAEPGAVGPIGVSHLLYDDALLAWLSSRSSAAHGQYDGNSELWADDQPADKSDDGLLESVDAVFESVGSSILR